MSFSFYQFLQENSQSVYDKLNAHYSRLVDQHMKQANEETEPGDTPFYTMRMKDGLDKSFHIEDSFSDRHHEPVLDSIHDLLKTFGATNIRHVNWSGSSGLADDLFGSRRPWKQGDKTKISHLFYDDKDGGGVVRIMSDHAIGMHHFIHVQKTDNVKESISTLEEFDATNWKGEGGELTGPYHLFYYYRIGDIHDAHYLGSADTEMGAHDLFNHNKDRLDPHKNDRRYGNTLIVMLKHPEKHSVDELLDSAHEDHHAVTWFNPAHLNKYIIRAEYVTNVNNGGQKRGDPHHGPLFEPKTLFHVDGEMY